MPRAWLESGLASPADLAACRALLRGGSRSFYAAAFLLPRRVHEPATALYAFCRLADDAIDLDPGHTDALQQLSARLDRIYQGRPDPEPADRALAAVVAHFDLPRTLLDALLEGFAWDAAGRRYEGLEQVHAYCARVAGSVGAMMALLMGARGADLAARASELGVAMQLTNIARDVGEDARAGRLYLPLAWLREAGIDPEAWLARPVFSAPLGHVIARLLEAADQLYARADAGIAGLPQACRPGINAARFLYAEIGREVERRGCDSVASRAVVSGARKAALLHRIVQASLAAPGGQSFPPLPATRFLVEAAVRSRPHTRDPSAIPRTTRSLAGVEKRAVWVLDLFERLERRDRSRRRGGAGDRRTLAAARS